MRALFLSIRRSTLPWLVLGAIVALSWWWIAAMAIDMYGPMAGASAWMMASEWTWTHVALLWAMWAVMMAAMMLPSAWPMLRTYAGFARRSPGSHKTWGLYAFASGYLFVWALFSIGATALQRALSHALVLSPMMEPTSARASAAALCIAGAWQLSPVKERCLRGCTTPLSFVMRWWQPGVGGAWRMGVRHGMLCVGCCWALMLLLFAGGVMHLGTIVALTGLVLAEKAIGWGRTGNRLSAAALFAAAAWLFVS